MKKYNKSYKKGEPFRDARLFVIACEGAKREKEYFEKLFPNTRRLKIKILSPKDDEDDNRAYSAPNKVLERVVKFVEKNNINIKTGDKLWFVLDIDRWKDEIFHYVQQECEKNGWKLALSNPCFEVWLWLHFAEMSASKSATCKQLKLEISQTFQYNPNVFTQSAYYLAACDKAKQTESAGFMPDFKTTKVHLLLGELLEMLGQNNIIHQKKSD